MFDPTQGGTEDLEKREMSGGIARQAAGKIKMQSMEIQKKQVIVPPTNN